VQALLILFGALFTVAVCLACGRLLLRDTETDWGIHFVAGAAVLSLVVFFIAAVGAVYPAVFVVVGAVVLWFGRGPGRSPSAGRKAWPHRWSVCLWTVLFAVWFVIYFLHAMAPEVSPDGSAYHLALVLRYLRDHGFHRITNNMYASLSQGVEMLFLFAFAFGRHSAAALVHFAFLVALVWQMFVYARRAGFPLAGGCAAFLVFASPVVGIDAASAYNDVAVAAIAFTLFHLLQIWEGNRAPRLLIAIGILAGFAYATKYTAALAVPYAVGYVAWKSRRWRDVLIVAGCAMILILPWMLKNWIWVGNPTSPFFNQWFPNPYVSTSFEAEYKEYLTHYDLTSRWQLPMQVTTYGALSGLIGPVFLLAPIALLAAFRREGWQLLLAALVFGATYFSNVGARFLIPPLPFVALAMMLVLSRIPALPIAVVIVHAWLSWPSVVPKYGRQDAWRLRGMPWREALRIRPESSWLERWIPDYDAIQLIETATPPGSTIFSTQPLPEAYTSRRILVEYYSTENQVTGRMLRSGAVPEYAPTLRLRFPFARQPLRAIRVVQTAAPSGPGGNLWSINEMRIFDGARELPRLPQWRLRARPYAWGIQNAFDNSPITFWISGDSLRTGMYVETNFGGAEEADAVEIQCAPNQWRVRLKLEGLPESAPPGRGDGTGWKTLAESAMQSEEVRPIGWRRAVVAELKRRGIDYVMFFDIDLGADDLHRNPDRWGILPIGKSKNARLYKLP
jgi:Dolichyl-phosphate-mannose-protein mannosyltransferase